MKEIKEAAAKSHAEKTHKMSGHSDEREDRCSGGKLAKGGAAKKGGKTQVNVVVAPRGGQNPTPAPGAPGPAGVSPPFRPAGPAPAPGGGLGALQGAKRGGEVKSRAHGGRVTGFHAGAGTGEGRLEKEEHYKRK